MPEEYRRVIMAGLILGVVAAGLVWWLERFESRRLIGEFQDYLRDSDIVDELRRRARSEDE